MKIIGSLVRKAISNSLYIGVLVIFIAWLGSVIYLGHDRASGAWNFATPGQFGDSFGVLSALMASLAAVGAWSALRIQRNEISSLEEQRRIDLKNASKRDFDAAFFGLLRTLDDIISDLDFRTEGSLLKRGETRAGRGAMRAFREQFYDIVKDKPKSEWEDCYKNWYTDQRDDFGHYFRFMYHIVVYIDSDSYNAVRSMLFLRSRLSYSELVLLGLNCAFGEGRQEFKFYVEKYHLLHNLDDETILKFDLRSHFRARAFEPGMSGKFLGRIMEEEMEEAFGETLVRAVNNEVDDFTYKHLSNIPDPSGDLLKRVERITSKAEAEGSEDATPS